MIEPANNTLGAPIEEDLTGRSRLTRNILSSWAAQSVFIVAGFVLPRMIDRRLGQEALGVWDFSWSMVAYFTLIQVGVVSSVNKYVAGYRATGDLDGLNCAVSSVTCILLVVGAIGAVLTVVAVFLTPLLLGDLTADYMNDAQWVILLIGASIVLEIAVSAFGGVLTGCYRHGVFNALAAGGNAATVGCMIVFLLAGGGLRGLAAINLCGEAARWAATCAVAYRVCPGLSVRLSRVRWSMCRQMLTFGGKTLAFSASSLLQNQMASILIAAYAGPAVLALYARPMGLIRNALVIMQRFAVVLTPTASSLQALGKEEDIRQLLVSATRYGAYIAVPMVTVLVILGNPILSVWMGDNYQEGGVLTILAIGYSGLLLQRTAFNVLVGLNAHGRVTLAYLIGAVLSVGLMFVALGVLHSGLPGVAVATAIPLLTATGLYLPMHACRRLGIPFGRYLVETLRGPILCALPLAACLTGARLLFDGRPLVAIACGMGAGGLLVAPLYWKYALPLSLKSRLRHAPALILGFWTST